LGRPRAIAVCSIDPREHVGLARLGAIKAAAALRARLGGCAPTSDEVLGAAYLGVEMATRTFRPGRARFSTLAVSNAYFMALRAGEIQTGYRGWSKGCVPTPFSVLRVRERLALGLAS
jgi:hypothetical protein